MRAFPGYVESDLVKAPFLWVMDTYDRAVEVMTGETIDRVQDDFEEPNLVWNEEKRKWE